MKILITNTGPWGSGSFSALDSIVEELEKEGHEVRVFFPYSRELAFNDNEQSRPHDKYKIWYFPISDGKETVEHFPLLLPEPHPKNPGAGTFKQLTDAQLATYFDELKKALDEVIEDFQPDVIECNHIWSIAYICSQYDIPTIAVAHNSDQMAFEFDPRMRPYALEAAKNVSAIIAISNKLQREIVDIYDVPIEKVLCIPNSFHHKIFRPQQLERHAVLTELGLTGDIPDDATIVSFAGKISKNKGIDVLLKANHYIEADLNTHFILMGPGELQEVMKDIDPASVNFDRVHFTGFVDQDMAARVHAISRLSVLPSRLEGFPMSCMEAMGCGLPVVISDLGGPEEYAVGEVIPQESPKELAKAIVRLVSMPDKEYEALAAEAHLKAMDITWENNVQQRLKIYQSLST